jgi:hypothetical protein
MAKRNYTAGVRAALISFSAGSCYWPGCGRRLLSNVAGEYFIDLDIAHICALEKGGPRYNSNMTDKQRNDSLMLYFFAGRTTKQLMQIMVTTILLRPFLHGKHNERHLRRRL